jgi:hypothetical protein
MMKRAVVVAGLFVWCAGFGLMTPTNKAKIRDIVGVGDVDGSAHLTIETDSLGFTNLELRLTVVHLSPGTPGAYSVEIDGGSVGLQFEFGALLTNEGGNGTVRITWANVGGADLSLPFTLTVYDGALQPVAAGTWTP